MTPEAIRDMYDRHPSLTIQRLAEITGYSVAKLKALLQDEYPLPELQTRGNPADAPLLPDDPALRGGRRKNPEDGPYDHYLEQYKHQITPGTHFRHTGRNRIREVMFKRYGDRSIVPSTAYVEDVDTGEVFATDVGRLAPLRRRR